MKYNVGDKVLIKSEDWYNQMQSIPNKLVWQNKLTNDFVGIWCGSHIFKESMFEFLGKTMTIQKVGIDFYLMEEDTCGYEFNDEMIECKVEEETKPKLKVGDEVRIKDIDIDGTIESIIRGQIIVDIKGSKIPAWPEDIVLMKSVEEKMSLDKAGQITDFEYDGLAYTLPEGYQFVDDNGNVINTMKIVLEKKHNDKLKLESTKKVREYWSEYTRIFIEIYDDEPNECVLTHLYTIEKHRQKGYGRQALSEAEEIAKELGCNVIYLKVETDSWMYQWYLRMGYKWYKNVNNEYTWLTKNI